MHAPGSEGWRVDLKRKLPLERKLPLWAALRDMVLGSGGLLFLAPPSSPL